MQLAQGQVRTLLADIPVILPQLIADPRRAESGMKAMFPMKNPEIDTSLRA